MFNYAYWDNDKLLVIREIFEIESGPYRMILKVFTSTTGGEVPNTSHANYLSDVLDNVGT